jgi:hypothetical protein
MAMVSNVPSLASVKRLFIEPRWWGTRELLSSILPVLTISKRDSYVPDDVMRYFSILSV